MRAGGHNFMNLPNDTKIRFCNAFHAINFHASGVYCHQCSIYLHSGEGDFCERGKEIIASLLCYADTNLIPPTDTPCSFQTAP